MATQCKNLQRSRILVIDDTNRPVAGKSVTLKVNLPPKIDVKRIRKKLRMTQAKFAYSFGFSIDAIKHWEGGRRTPEASTRAYLIVIAKNPKAVLSALHPDQVRLPAISRGRSAGKRGAT